MYFLIWDKKISVPGYNLSLADFRRNSIWASWCVPSIVWRNDDKEINLDSLNHKEFPCKDCGRVYKLKSSLRNHQKWECGIEPQFQCPYCFYRAKQKMHVSRHLERVHKDKIMLSEHKMDSVQNIENV